MWNNRDPTRGTIKTWYVQELEMATLCNKKVTRTRTISNATGYSMYTWAIACTRGKHLQQKSPPATHAKIILWWSIFHHRSRHFYDDFVRFVIDMQKWCDFYDEPVFVIKLKLWQIWLFQWRNLFVIEVDISSNDMSPTVKRRSLWDLGDI